MFPSRGLECMNASCSYMPSVYLKSSISVYSTHRCPLWCIEETRFIFGLRQYFGFIAWLEHLGTRCLITHEVGNVNKVSICRVNQIFHVVFPTLFRPLLLSPVCWPLTHLWTRALTLQPTPDSAPLTRANSSAHLGGLDTPDNKQL